MSDVSDMELLQNYDRQGSEDAFAELVRRHINLVYSAAFRRVGIAAHAEEITQAVFVILARKAVSLRPDTVLEGWLYETTRLTSSSFLRGERRRQFREQEAYMQSTLNESNDPSIWNQMSPLLDEAMARLGKKDRDAVVLRFFKEKNLGEVAAALNVTEAAAQSRVHRALEKLHRYFNKRGVSSTTAIIAGAISANSVQAAPVTLAKTVTAVAIAKGAAASGSTLTLIKGALKIMAWTKAKTAIVVGVTAILATTTTVIVEKVIHPKSSSTDISWADDPQYWKPDSRVLEKIPPVFILRPMRFANQGGSVQVGNRYMAKSVPVKELLEIAYTCPESRTIFPEDVPSERFDLMLTVPNHPREMLQDEIKKRFGLTAHRETRVEDVLILKVSNPNASGIKVSAGLTGLDSSWMGLDHETTIKNERFDGFAASIENQLNIPVLNQTGLDKRYDIHINWQAQAGESAKDAFKRALVDQLGLELVPSRAPVEMLVVEKAQ